MVKIEPNDLDYNAPNWGDSQKEENMKKITEVLIAGTFALVVATLFFSTYGTVLAAAASNNKTLLLNVVLVIGTIVFIALKWWPLAICSAIYPAVTVLTIGGKALIGVFLGFGKGVMILLGIAIVVVVVNHLNHRRRR